MQLRITSFMWSSLTTSRGTLATDNTQTTLSCISLRHRKKVSQIPLTNKLDHYGIKRGQNTIAWIKGFLSIRIQHVFMEREKPMSRRDQYWDVASSFFTPRTCQTLHQQVGYLQMTPLHTSLSH